MRREAAEIRERMAGQQLASIADEVREALALHDAHLGALDLTMQAAIDALRPAEPEEMPRRHLRLVRDGEAS